MLTVHFTMKSLPLLDTGQIGFSSALGQQDNGIISDADLEPLTFQCSFFGSWFNFSILVCVFKILATNV